MASNAHIPAASKQFNGFIAEESGDKRVFCGWLSTRDSVELKTGDLSMPEKMIVKRMSEALSKVSNLLDQMNKLSDIAAKNTITDNERIDIQLQMTDLQANLHSTVYSMGLSLGGLRISNSLGGDRSFASLSKNEGFSVNELGENIVGYVVVHDENEDISSIPPEFADLKIGEIILEPLFERNAQGKMTTAVTFIEASDTNRADDLRQSLLEAQQAGASIGEFLQREDIRANAPVDMLTVEGAKRFRRKALRERGKLNDLRATLSQTDFKAGNAAMSQPDGSLGQGKTARIQSTVSTRFGEMRFHNSNRNDLRLQNTSTKLGQTFKELDDFLKDSVYTSVGMGDIWKPNPAASDGGRTDFSQKIA